MSKHEETKLQIEVVFEELSDSNLDRTLEELYEITRCGDSESASLLRSCLNHNSLLRKDLRNPQLHSAIVLVFKFLLCQINFCKVFTDVLGTAINEGFLADLSDELCLSSPEKIAMGLALSESEDSNNRKCGKNFCMAQIEKLFASPSNIVVNQQIQDVFTFLHRFEDPSKYLDTFTGMLRLVQFRDSSPIDLAPYVSDELEEADIFRNLDFLDDCNDSDFDAVVAELEKENSVDETIKELGYGCTIDTLKCTEVLSRFSPLTEKKVSRIIGIVARTYTGLEDNQLAFSAFLTGSDGNPAEDVASISSWNIGILINSIKELAPDINWLVVMQSLDHQGFYLPSEGSFDCLMTIYKHACQEPFPLAAVIGSIWDNAEGQLSFLKYAISAPPEVFTFSHSLRQLENIDAAHGLKTQVANSNNAWLCLDLLDIFCQFAERGHAAVVLSMLEYPLQHYPEVLLLGISHINTPYNFLQFEVLSRVFPNIIGDPMGSRTVHHLWHASSSLVLLGFVNILNSNRESTPRVVDICQEIKILTPVLEMLPPSHGIRLAAVASQKELLDLEKWLSDNLITYKDIFFEECVTYLKEIHLTKPLQGTDKRQVSDAAWMSHPQTTSTFFKVLQANSSILTTSHLSDEIERLRIALLNANSSQQNEGVNDSPSPVIFAEDIESEANSYFQRMFAEQLTIDEMVQMLGRFKESSNKREQSIFECMIANLFEEYRFFPKYPEKQLGLAAILFGLLIKYQLVTHITLGIALRGVLDALRKPADSRMFSFGTKALEQFKNRLDDWPQYCNHILQISHLRGTHPELVAYIEGVLAKMSHGANGSLVDQQHMSTNGTTANEPSLPLQLQRSSSDGGNKASGSISSYSKPLLSSGSQATVVSSSDTANSQKSPVSGSLMLSSPGIAQASRGSTSTRFGSALNIETLVAAAERRETPIEAPSSDIQDKVSFIVNNISATTVESKAKEFSEILNEQYYTWFAQYMVMKRASIEPNFHELYLKFLEKVNSKGLIKEIIKATYENCRVLLGSELIKSSSEERSLLKNLGSWLGKLTIGRNQVLTARDIDPKSLIVEAYEKGLMIAVIPFTSKILEPCQSSLAYRPPNPWTMGILSLLAEIYVLPNLKMNLKFDIEVLFKNLGVTMKDVIPSALLKDRVRVAEGNPDFSNKDSGTPQPLIVSEDKSGAMSALNQVELPLEVATASHLGSHPNSIPPYAAPGGTLLEEDKLAAMGFSDQLPSAQGLLQATASQSPYSLNQLPLSVPSVGHQHVIVNQSLNGSGLYAHFQRVLPGAMDAAIKDIVDNVVQRSVTISTQTTKELVMKDYAFESDESRILYAANLMVASLAGSLAHVTCKELLRGSITGHLKNMLQGLNVNEEMLKEAIAYVTNDNLDLGCAIIEQAATEKATQTIDREIMHQLSLRRKHRENFGPSSLYDSSIYAQGSIGGLPETLRPKPGRLSLCQQRVYEDFNRIPWQNQQPNQSSSSLVTTPAASGVVGLPRPFNSSSGQQSPSVYSSGLGNSGFVSFTHPSGLVADEMEPTSSQIPRGVEGVQQHSEIDPVITSSSPIVSVPEQQIVESTKAIKESGVTLLPTSSTSASEPLMTTGDALEKYELVASKLGSLLANDGRDAEIQPIVSEVLHIIMRSVSRDEVAMTVAQKVLNALYDNASSILHVSAHLAILASIRDVCKMVVKWLTNWVVYPEEERKFNKDITVGLIRRELINLAEYSIHMAKLIDAGRNKAATEFSIALLQFLLCEEPKVVSELQNLVDALAKLAARPGSPESLLHLVDVARNPTAHMAALSGMNMAEDDKARQARDTKAAVPSLASKGDYNGDRVENDVFLFDEQVRALFVEWLRVCELPPGNDAACTHYISQLHQNGLLKGDETSDRFFRIILDLSVKHCLNAEVKSSGALQLPQQGQHLSFFAIDICAKLIFSILKYYPADQGSSKFFLLPKILAVIVGSIQKDADDNKTSFNPRPYFRLFINLLLDIGVLDPVHDGVNFQVVTAFANAFHALQPLKVPAFSFAWLELVSHRTFMPKLLSGNSQKGWPYLHRLLLDLFQFMEPFLRNAELGDLIRFLYKGTLRVLLVLLHDFPEFLCDYHFSFCDVIPASCIQMRNIILSAFPRNMRLPDPSTPNLKIDLLQEMAQPPRILSEVDAVLKAKHMKADVDEYLKTRQQGSSFPNDLKQRLLLLPNEASKAGTRYNVPLINSLVLYVGMQAIQQLQPRNSLQQQSVSSSLLVEAAADIFLTLIVDLDTEGRYLFLNAMANQLRYPNNHTHYFSYILLHLFHETHQMEIIQEQITRVLLERLIVNRPHPWGLLITFIELIKNPRYNFWSKSFTRCAPEIEKLFESVSRSCGGPKPVSDSMVGTVGLADAAH